MSQERSWVASKAARFDPTRWSVVLKAAQSESPGSAEALAKLCGHYWPPLYAFARRAHSPEDAKDLVQGFFEHLIGNRALTCVSPTKGRFRSFLLTSFQRFMAAEARREHRQKRGGRAEVIRLDLEDAEGRLAFEPADRLTPEALYDAQWAVFVLDRVVERLRREHETAGKTGIFAAAATP